MVKIEHENESYMPGVIFLIVVGRNLDVEFDLAVITTVERELSSSSFPAKQGVSLNLSAPSVY